MGILLILLIAFSPLILFAWMAKHEGPTEFDADVWVPDPTERALRLKAAKARFRQRH